VFVLRLHPVEDVASARRHPGRRAASPGAAEAITGSIDVAAALAQRDYMTSDWSDRTQTPWLDSMGIELVRGHGRLAGARTVEVELADGGGTRTLHAHKAVVVACGTVPAMPPIDGLAAAKPWDNRDATAVKEIPTRLVVMGGGAIGVEMAQGLRRLGSQEVTVIEGADRLLAREEPFAGEQVQAAFEAEGITVLTKVRVVKVERDAPDRPVTVVLDDGRRIEGDELLVAVGRRPNTGDIGLDTVGLEPGKYVDVDDRLRAKGVGDEWLYAVGDVNGLALLTHMGKYQGRLFGDVVAGKDVRDEADHGMVPRVTFTDPQVAAVGLTEQQARDEGLNVRVVTTPTGGVAGAYVQGNGIDGTCQIVVDEDHRTIVGATFTGPGIQELLHSATVAIAGRVTLDRLWHAVPAFPTVSEVWLRLLEAYGL
jgi:dihydrolipoamide dehydrogenase